MCKKMTPKLVVLHSWKKLQVLAKTFFEKIFPGSYIFKDHVKINKTYMLKFNVTIFNWLAWLNCTPLKGDLPICCLHCFSISFCLWHTFQQLQPGVQYPPWWDLTKACVVFLFFFKQNLSSFFFADFHHSFCRHVQTRSNVFSG